MVDTIKLLQSNVELAEPELQPISHGQTQRDFSLDVIRAYAIFLVILVHASGPYLHTMAAESIWWPACILNVAGRSCVPLFLMVSGLLLLSDTTENRNQSIAAFLKKRVTKVLVPLATWSIIYITWIDWNLNFKMNATDLLAFVGKPACYHLAYLYYLLGLYLAVPILRVFLANAKAVQIHYFLGLWFVASSIWPCLAFWFGTAPPVTFAVATGYVGLFVLGHTLKDIKLSKGMKCLGILYFALYIPVVAFATHQVSGKTAGSGLNEFYLVYTSPLVVAYSILTFMTLRSFKYRIPENAKKIISSLSAASFTIYLAHPLIMDSVALHLRGMVESSRHKTFNAYIYILAVTIVTLAISWVFVRCCRFLRIPHWLIP